MNARLRSTGIGATLAAMAAMGAFLLPAAPAQAQRASGACQMLASSISMSFANGLWGYALSQLDYGHQRGCW